jgi:transcriptional repressor NrdR
LKVIKKDGRVQDLELYKIKIGILNAADTTKQMLNESDINLIVKDIVKTIEEQRSKYGHTSCYEIVGVVIEVLKRNGFSDIISSYIGYEK